MYATRIPAMKAAGLDPGRMKEKKELDVLPRKVRQVADNYNHLHEQPTLFYAVAIVLHLIGQGGGLNLALAWAYVGLRVGHSLLQATVNKIEVRFALFALGSLALLALTIHAAIALA
jgi:hypothetical protein